MTTFAALGDSITLGVGDPAPGGGWRGWAAFLAQGLPGGHLVNLAANGARAADVERVQLPRALELRPDVASVIVGTNDILRAGFDVARIQAALAHVAGSLSAAGAVVLTMRLPDPGMMLGLPAALARPLARRLQVINEVMDQVAEQFGTLHFDAAAEPATYERRMWSADRLHPSERGHRYIAGCFHDRLAAHGHPVGPRPGAEPTSPAPTRYDTAAWMATKGTAWVLRRSTDLLPFLLFMAVRECWPGLGPHAQPPPLGPLRGGHPMRRSIDPQSAGLSQRRHIPSIRLHCPVTAAIHQCVIRVGDDDFVAAPLDDLRDPLALRAALHQHAHGRPALEHPLEPLVARRDRSIEHDAPVLGDDPNQTVAPMQIDGTIFHGWLLLCALSALTLGGTRYHSRTASRFISSPC